jgi:cytochrome c oxidase cbb3-type subunit 3
MKNLNKVILVLTLLLMVAALSTSLLTPENSVEMLADPKNWLVITAGFFLIIAFMATFQALDAMKYMLAKKEGRLPAAESEADTQDEEEDEWLSGIMQKLTDAAPVDEEERVATDHEYDGIRELDNNLPPWWLAGFYISIAFAVVYLLRYHVFQSAPLPAEEFKIEMAAAEAAKEEYLKTAANLVDESNVAMVESDSRMLSGQAIFTKNCAVCHAKDGGGGVGPNLTDNYTLHGPEITDVFSVIKYGVAAKGMIPWKDQLSAAEMQDVASYVMTLRGTTPASPKEPQGDPIEASIPSNTTDSTKATTDTTAMNTAAISSL